MSCALSDASHPAFRNEKPTVLMIVDRTELEGQLFRELSGYGLDFQEARSKAHLKELLANDFRGLIVSMIHKFDGVPGNLSERDNVFVLVDEAHRSTGGDLGNYLVAALPNATFIGFTGTPIDRTAHGAGTFKTFGVDDAPRGYLDKYSISESIEDGTTLPLHYTLAPNELRVPKEELEKQFLDLKEAEGISDIEELNRILDRAVSLKTFLKADDRLEQVAQFVARHFKESVEPKGYKAFLVGVDREACALYKKALDRYLPPEESAVVFSAGHNDEPYLSQFHLDEAAEKRLRQGFVRSDKLPKILIVTEKLLTGFDAPVLYCLYLDKPMRDHTLLQAIARVNRPYEDAQGGQKPCGFVVDFVGIFANHEKALLFDSDEVASVIQNVDVLRHTFERLMKTSAVPYLELTRGARDDKLVERAVEFFTDRARRDEFNRFFAEIRNLHDILSPDPFLRPYLGEYKVLTRLSALIQQAFGRQTGPIHDLTKDTENIVRERVSAYGFSGTLPLVRIDEEALAALKRDHESKSVTRVINLGRSFTTTIAAEATRQGSHGEGRRCSDEGPRVSARRRPTADSRGPAARRQQEFKERIQSWAARIGVRPRRVQIQSMRKKWASCSEAGTLTFSENLLRETRRFREYVIVHELLHLQVRNHGRLFKAMMKAYLAFDGGVAEAGFEDACCYPERPAAFRGRVAPYVGGSSS